MTHTIEARRRKTGGRGMVAGALAIAGVALTITWVGTMAGGCAEQKPPRPKLAPYQNVGPRKNLPAYLKSSVFELVDLANNEPLTVSAYGLVGQLRGTGDTKAPPAVRQWVIKEMVRHGFGSRTMGLESIPPGRILASPDFAVVRVDAQLPPGARSGDRIDAFVTAIPNETTSLAHGTLFETELKQDGADPQAPSAAIQTWVKCAGPILVNPAYALETGATPTGAAKASLRRGTLPNSAVVYQDRPLWLMLRQPQHSVSRAIERRINDRFQQEADHQRKDGNPGYQVAQAFDEGIVQVYVPRVYRGDWEHFAGVVTHLYMNGSPDFSARKAKELAEEATRPKAPLMDISYCWEGLGAPSMPFITKLMSHNDPAVAFAAARAAAFIGDPSMAAQETLIRMAERGGHPFQISAIQVLGKLPASTQLSELLRGLLNAPEARVRIEAYNVLSDLQDPAVFSRSVRRRNDDREKFVLDVVPGTAPPMIYASQRGQPRIAIVGRTPTIRQPLTFATLDNRLTIATTEIEGEDGGSREVLTIYYRDPRRHGPDSAIKILSRPDVAELAARLAGEGAPGDQRLDFTYGEVVAILQALSDRGHVVAAAPGPDGRQLAASFILQESPHVANEINSAPVIDEGRPQGNTPAGPVGMR